MNPYNLFVSMIALANLGAAMVADNGLWLLNIVLCLIFFRQVVNEIDQ